MRTWFFCIITICFLLPHPLKGDQVRTPDTSRSISKSNALCPCEGRLETSSSSWMLLLGWGEEEGKGALSQHILKFLFSPSSASLCFLRQQYSVGDWTLPFSLWHLIGDNTKLTQGNCSCLAPFLDQGNIKPKYETGIKPKFQYLLSLTDTDLILCIFKHCTSLFNECSLKGETLKTN